MLFSTIGLLAAIWAALKYKEEHQLNWVFVGLALLLFSVDFYLQGVGWELENFYSASGPVGSGLTFEQCALRNETSGVCETWVYHTYLDSKDSAVAAFIAYRDTENAVLGTMGGLMWGLVLLALIYLGKEMLVKFGYLQV